MMVLMPHFLNDIHPSMSEAFLRYPQAYTLILRKNCSSVITEDDLVAIDMAILHFHNSFRSVFAAHMVSMVCTHLAARLSAVIQLLQTAHSIATSRGEHTVVQQSQRIDVELASSAGCNLLSQQPELRQLSTLLQEACATLHMAMPVFINVVNTAVLAASVDWEPDCSVAQTVRATPCFYNRPWFDNVALNTEPESFAQLRLLFTAGDMKLAMVRCYQELPPKEQAAHVLSKHGNTRLRWAQQGHSYE
ncbi:uncharacterized protein HaLaN_30304, partial [Haematococcus lacustris]